MTIITTRTSKGFILFYVISIIALIALTFGVVAGIIRSTQSSSSQEYFYTAQDNIIASCQAWLELHRDELKANTARKVIPIPIEAMGIRSGQANIIITPQPGSYPQITVKAQIKSGRQQRKITHNLTDYPHHD